MRKASLLATELKGSEIIKLAGEIKDKIKAGQTIYNFTIGDFDPKIFPIPQVLEDEIINAYKAKQTNYPPSNGILELRQSLSAFIEKKQGLKYSPLEFLIAGGGRPLIYAAFQAILDPEENALFPVPSWNNNHYTTLSRGKQVSVVASAKNNFMPSAADLKPHIADAGIIALCSPLNPTGTVFPKEQLKDICELVIAENQRRAGIRKPLYVIYDQIYWQLCFGDTKHHDPVSLVPEMRDYTIYIDGISKAYGATGVRVGWSFGPPTIIDKMKSILGHLGAWAPKPEQVATAKFLNNEVEVDKYLHNFKAELNDRLQAFYESFKTMHNDGLPVDVIAPQAAIYLTVKIDLVGRKTDSGHEIKTVQDTTAYLLDEAGIALVPFTAFGAEAGNPWYRLSVGTSKKEEIKLVTDKLRNAINRLT
ncbi:pyridoxal phosphate-dependent aminotransferase [Cryomorpha ignava]|uniref:Pyridoxal phosphate-dependent aminotransferase n=2 Tax=Cryomorpha ignava TaxID=101383 RepID=A0A7K3WNY7_9FLAO|nr:pyridoxal phosphate-dependent aminotransferase [Cryomorpha ignava]